MAITTDVRTKVRIGKRRGNEARLAQALRSASGDAAEQMTLSCECRDVECAASISITIIDFSIICRANGYGLVMPGHATDGDRVIALSPGYLLLA